MNSSAPSTSRQAICPICRLKPTKYTCPGCSTPTCSLSCSKGHKSQTGCSGQRNKAAYVPMNKYGWGQMMDDYTYLEDVGRRSSEWKDKSKDHASFKKGKGKREALKSYLETQGIHMELLPWGCLGGNLTSPLGMQGSSRSQTAYLTVEVKSHSGTSKTTAITHRHRLDASLESIIAAHPSSWCTFGDAPVDLSRTLGQILKGKSFVEYPAFDVWEERPRKLGPGVMKGMLSGYASDEDNPAERDASKAPQALALLGAYDSDTESQDPREPQSSASEVEVDWGDSDGDE
ncbi:hypothetical protein BDZ89DRAFT_1066027 [Hymenopellis radicata]|nr:hypothetical protein BDZ89DRAFT_1066027 [Hymenopellis radicata]